MVSFCDYFDRAFKKFVKVGITAINSIFKVDFVVALVMTLYIHSILLSLYIDRDMYRVYT